MTPQRFASGRFGGVARLPGHQVGRVISNMFGGFVIPRAGLAAQFDAALGITSSGGFASAWADQSGNGRSLLQATGANQPIHLPFAGTKYGYLPGVAGNYFSTPDSVAASITGDIDIRVKAALSNWNLAAAQILVSKLVTPGNFSYDMYLDSGYLTLRISTDGTAVKTAQTASLTSFAAGAVGFVRGTRSAATGEVVLYESADGVTWTPLGAPISTAVGGIFDSTQMIQLGAFNGASLMTAGRIYSAQIYNGIDGTLAVDFDPSRWTSGTTVTATTGEEWTINSTGSKPAQIVDRPSLLFDGAAHYMKTDPFTLNQPETVYLVAKQVSWTNQDYFFDGVTSNTGVLFQNNATPQLSIYAGNLVGADANLQVGVAGVIGVVFNGATSSLQVNGNAAATGNAGASNMGGITLGANGSAPGVVNNLSNIQAYEVLIYNVAHDAATRSNIIRALMSKHGVA